MNQKYIVSIGYTKLAFDNAETAMRVYALLTESTPVAEAYIYGSEFKRPESLETVQWVRSEDVEIELKRADTAKFATHLTADEFKEKCRIKPTEIDGEMRVVETEVPPAQIEGPAETEPEEFI